MLIDYTFFITSIFIAQKSQLEVRENIEMYIKQEEPLFLRKLLGKELANDFMQGISEPIPLQKWVDLKNILVDQNLKKSPIANYVYCSILTDEVTQNTGIGVVKTEGENSVKASPVKKIVDAWNNMVKMVCEIHKEIKETNEFPEYEHKDRNCICEDDSFYHCGCRKAVFSYRNTLGI